jgi:hypothetical protein
MMSHGVILGLLDLPMEILLEILTYLDAYELVRARGVRKKSYIKTSLSHDLLDMQCTSARD